jgi:uncharacterized damage-inducible protein DinB
MNKAYFTELAAFNTWADAKAISWPTQISGEQWNRSNKSSFGSVRQTAIHIASAEKIWTDFWTKKSVPKYLSQTFTGSKEELISIWQKASEEMDSLISNHPETDLNQLVSFIYPDGRTGQMSYYQTFAHSINHSTYHRGQLVTLLRQAGFEHFSSLDLATFYLSNKS